MNIAIMALVLLPHPPGLPVYTHPTDPSAREEAKARVWEVYRAIDEATPDPQRRMEMRRICRRESACNWIGIVGVHEGDARGGAKRWRKAVSRGLLEPDVCPEHDLGDGARWSTSGVFGVASAWVVHSIGECVAPEVLADPFVAARATSMWMDTLCRRHQACDCEGRVRWWVGPGVWAKRSSLANLDTIEGQCGERPWVRWVVAALQDAAAWMEYVM